MKRLSNRTIIIAASVVLVIGLAVVASRFLPAPPDEEQVLALFEEVRAAQLDDDFDDVWDVLSESRRRLWADKLSDLQATGDMTTEDREFWSGFSAEWGVDREEVLRMDPCDWYALTARGTAGSRPEICEVVEGLDVRAVKVDDGPMARVELRSRGDALVIYSFEKVAGKWCFHGWAIVTDVTDRLE